MITVNGKEIDNAENLSLSSFLKRESYNIKFIAVECNGQIIPKSKYEEKILKCGDRLEVVSFVGGG